MSTDFSLLADDVIDAFSDDEDGDVVISKPIDGPINEYEGARSEVPPLVAKVRAIVGRTNQGRLEQEVLQEEVEVAVRVMDVAFEVDEACTLRIVGRDRIDQQRQITAVDRVVGGTMYQITTSRMK